MKEWIRSNPRPSVLIMYNHFCILASKGLNSLLFNSYGRIKSGQPAGRCERKRIQSGFPPISRCKGL